MPMIFVYSTSVQRCSGPASISNVVRSSNRGQNRTKNVQGRKVRQGAVGYQGGKHQKGPCSLCWTSLLMADYSIATRSMPHGAMQAYPLYATIGLGCAGAVLYLGRLALGPDTM